MQRLLCEKVMASESMNPNSEGKDTSQRKILVLLDLFCLFLGECCSFFLFCSDGNMAFISISVPTSPSLCPESFFFHRFLFTNVFAVRPPRVQIYFLNIIHLLKDLLLKTFPSDLLVFFHVAVYI